MTSINLLIAAACMGRFFLAHTISIDGYGPVDGDAYHSVNVTKKRCVPIRGYILFSS